MLDRLLRLGCRSANDVSNTQTMHSEKRSGPREGGSRAMEEIRKQRLVRGDRRRIKGIRLTGGLVIRRSELPRVCY